MIIKLQHPKFHDADGDELPYPDRDRFYFELQADGNHETICTSEIYESREAAEHAIGLIETAGVKNNWVVFDAT